MKPDVPTKVAAGPNLSCYAASVQTAQRHLYRMAMKRKGCCKNRGRIAVQDCGEGNKLPGAVCAVTRAESRGPRA